MKNLVAKKILGKASSVVRKLFQEIILLLMHGARGHRLELFIENKGSAQNGSKTSCKQEAFPYLHGMVPYRTVPKSRVNAALKEVRTYHARLPLKDDTVLEYCFYKFHEGGHTMGGLLMSLL